MDFMSIVNILVASYLFTIVAFNFKKMSPMLIGLYLIIGVANAVVALI